MVDVGFDELLVFPEATPAERVNEAAGERLLTGEHYQSSAQLFIFRSGGRGFLASMVTSDVFVHEVQNATVGPDVRIIDPGREQLSVLVD